MTTPWLYRPAVRADARARLFCFTHAGVSAVVYRPWAEALPRELEVCAIQLPGRGTRMREAPVASIAALVDAVLPAIRPALDLPFAFFGHSMGALLSREVAGALAASGGPVPGQLIVSGRRPPAMPDPYPPLRGLSDAEFVAEINRRYGGIPPELLRHADVMELLLPALRADIHALETFVPRSSARLACPITVYGGSDDRYAPREHLEAWHAETDASCRVRVFPGDHFFVESQRVAVLEDVAATLAPLLRDARSRETVQ